MGLNYDILSTWVEISLNFQNLTCSIALIPMDLSVHQHDKIFVCYLFECMHWIFKVRENSEIG